MTKEGVFFEDIKIGVVERFGHYAVLREEAIAFARQYDPQPFHLDDDAAAASHFGRLAVSGWHTGAMSMAMMVAHFDEMGHAGLGGAGLNDLRWIRPVYPGDTLSMETVAQAKRRSRSRPEMGIVEQHVTVRNQHGEAVMTYTAMGMVKVRQP